MKHKLTQNLVSQSVSQSVMTIVDQLIRSCQVRRCHYEPQKNDAYEWTGGKRNEEMGRIAK